MADKRYYNEITILKAIATLFITWFHFKWTVPEALSPIFVGGAIGNSIFFFCSGYLLKFKEERYTGQWVVSKYFRIMPAVWGMYMFVFFFNYIRGIRAHGLWQSWIYPTEYWFVNNILMYFLLVYMCKRFIAYNPAEDVSVAKRRNLIILAIATLLLNIVWFELYVDHTMIVMDEGGVKCWYFFFFFLWGYYVRNYGEKIKASNWAWLECILAIVMFFAYKKISVYSELLVRLQEIFIPLFLAYVILTFRKVSKIILKWQISERFKSMIIFLSNITLEIYIVQMFVINLLMPLFPFPVNVVSCLASILFMAWALHVVTIYITSKLDFLK